MAKTTAKELHAEKHRYNFIQQPEGFIQIDPVPDAAELKGIYTEDYYGAHYEGWVEKTIREADYWRLVFDERIEVLERFVPQRERRIVDVGSFIGLFLEVARRRDWDVLGVDPAIQGIQHCQQKHLPVIQGFFEDIPLAELGEFDAVNLSLTLEHVANPREILDRAFLVLKPGGVVCVEVPNEYSPTQTAVKKLLDKDDYWLAPPHHINYFNFDSLRELLASKGFQVVHESATFPMEFFVLMGDNYIGDDVVGGTCHQKRMALEKNLSRLGLKGFKQRLYEFFAKEKIGREVVMVAQKPR